jgi:prepilin-type N-terminal cleavage/methylation domain-containing protein/prepilin-type processing-associated H-X9-DG protein
MVSLVASFRSRAFTLTEVLVVVGIFGILITLLIPNATSILNRAQGVVCAGRLKNLYIAFHDRVVIDRESWPQLPTNVKVGSVAEQQWWLDTGSNSLGLTVKDWSCPTIARLIANSSNSVAQSHLISYLPMLFDDSPATPMRWPWMPWFTEIANVHGHGAQMIMGDGHVTTEPLIAPNGTAMPPPSSSK